MASDASSLLAGTYQDKGKETSTMKNRLLLIAIAMSVMPVAACADFDAYDDETDSSLESLETRAPDGDSADVIIETVGEGLAAGTCQTWKSGDLHTACAGNCTHPPSTGTFRVRALFCTQPNCNWVLGPYRFLNGGTSCVTRSTWATTVQWELGPAGG
jgi:hypothetical protein